MHFWIDKRSQQCGFGRSRVAASLAGAGSNGFGHPPRRINRHKTTATTSQSALTNVHRQQQQQTQQNNSYQQQHHQQQYYAQQQQQQQQHHQQQQQTTSFTTTADCHVLSRNAQHYPQPHQQHQHSSNNNNLNNLNQSVVYTAAAPSASASTATPPYNANNNAHNQQQHQQLFNTSGNHLNAIAHSNNNNHAATSSAAILTGSGTVIPVATNSSGRHNQRGNSTNAANNSSNSSTSICTRTPSTMYTHAGSSQSDVRSYHYHPQFGNMAVRHYYPQQQHQQQQQQPQQQTLNISGSTAINIESSAIIEMPRLIEQQLGDTNALAAPQQQPQQQAHMSYYYQPQSTSANAVSATALAGSGAAGASTTTVAGARQSSNYTPHRYMNNPIRPGSNSMNAQHHNYQQQPRPNNAPNYDGNTDVDLMPLHLKCGMCASLVLASVFVAGAKFYFDHQGTGLEVLIFCAFSATFFLAACSVSLCRLPKSLRSTRGRGNAAGHGERSQYNSAVTTTRNSNSLQTGLVHPDSDLAHSRIASSQITTAISTEPPPYHIAILLPENSRSNIEHSKEGIDESPPPSYDKILI